ncbi:MAG: hypothetical protein EZS28_010395 [Streblomastix strix]|uniref:Uncharacterized protein n=1 Tax=Streblomastix strix TaxID=222440 RepID=A0A5J4WGK9_9EUKA|nr:MAG: hypothetical protein EZS28_010395 [Streblomastix strix]
MTLLSEEVNRENVQDQGIMKDLETTKVQEKLEWMYIGAEMDLKPETNQEAEAEERIEEGKLQQDIDQIKFEQDSLTKRTHMQKDAPENHSDRDSTWTEDEVPLHQIATSQPKQPVQQTQRVQQIQVQPKQQAPVQIPRQSRRKDASPNKDNIDEQEILQEMLAAF